MIVYGQVASAALNGQRWYALEEEGAWQRGEYVGKQGWMPGERAPDRPAAEASAALLMPTRSSGVLRENGNGDHATR